VDPLLLGVTLLPKNIWRIQLYRTTQDYAGLCRAMLGYTGLRRAMQGHTGLYRDIRGYTTTWLTEHKGLYLAQENTLTDAEFDCHPGSV